MEKDFDKWNNLKKSLENKNSNILFKEWDIWWISVWLNIQEESCWKWENYRRPVLIIKKLSNNNCIWIPLSSKYKDWTWFSRFDLQGIEKDCFIVLNKNVSYK